MNNNAYDDMTDQELYAFAYRNAENWNALAQLTEKLESREAR